jgi:hypothetical protein
MTACVICGQRVELVRGPRICESCALYARKVEDAKTLAGSPSERAVRQEIRPPRCGTTDGLVRPV